MPNARINGQNIHYRDTVSEAGNDAPRDAPVIAFSHGLLMDHEMFGPQLHALRHHYRCIVWDQRGHGHTAGDNIEPFTYRDSADDLAALLTRLDATPTVLVGMSQGGFVSLRCALRRPELVRGLILIDSQAGLEDPAKVAGYRQMLDVWIAQGLQAQIADTIAQIIIGSGYRDVQHWKDKWAGWKPPNLAACFETLTGRDDVTERLAEIRVPTLIIHGEADMAIPMERAEIMQRKLPNARLVRIPGASHAANLTHPDTVNAAMADFLQTLA